MKKKAAGFIAKQAAFRSAGQGTCSSHDADFVAVFVYILRIVADIGAAVLHIAEAGNPSTVIGSGGGFRFDDEVGRRLE